MSSVQINIPGSLTTSLVIKSNMQFFFSANRASTPGYNDPPPEYETAATGLSQSCSCMTQLTTVADDYGKTLLSILATLIRFWLKYINVHQ